MTIVSAINFYKLRSITSHFTVLLALFEWKSTKVRSTVVRDKHLSKGRCLAQQFYSSGKCWDVYWEMENGTKTFAKIIIDTISSIWKNSERTDIYSIFKALVKNNATNLDIHSLEKEVKNMEENGILG